MQTFETTEPAEARRCRYAQFGGTRASVTLAGATVTGVIYSVKEDASSKPKKWIIKIVPK